MDFNRKLENILQDIRDIEHDAVDMSNANEISRIEMDLLMGKVRNLYDKLIQVDRNYIYTGQDEQQDVPQTYSRGKKEPGQQPDPSDSEGYRREDEDNPRVAPRQGDENARQTVTKHEEASRKEKQEPETEQTRRRENQEASAPSSTERTPASKAATWQGSGDSKAEGPEIVADRYQNSKTFRHDDLAKKQPQNNLSNRMQTKPIHDLGKAIGLNDKFLFVRELFGGDKDKYHEAIQIINEMPDYREAEQYIKQFQWDEENPEVSKFMDLVRRKFSV